MSLKTSSNLNILICKIRINDSVNINIEFPYTKKTDLPDLEKMAENFIRGLSVSSFSFLEIVDSLTLKEYQTWVSVRDFLKEEKENEKKI